MLIRDHLARVESFDRSLARLDPIDDTELYVVFLMRAATNRVNAALHALDLTEEGPVARTVRIGDMNHTYKPPMDFELPGELHAAFRALKSIEDLRPEYVRGPQRLTPQLAASCRQAYAEVVAATDAILKREKAPS
jgi:hypothetical protein